jgi:hypothetical protein
MSSSAAEGTAYEPTLDAASDEGRGEFEALPGLRTQQSRQPIEMCDCGWRSGCGHAGDSCAGRLLVARCERLSRYWAGYLRLKESAHVGSELLEDCVGYGSYGAPSELSELASNHEICRELKARARAVLVDGHGDLYLGVSVPPGVSTAAYEADGTRLLIDFDETQHPFEGGPNGANLDLDLAPIGAVALTAEQFRSWHARSHALDVVDQREQLAGVGVDGDLVLNEHQGFFRSVLDVAPTVVWRQAACRARATSSIASTIVW